MASPKKNNGTTEIKRIIYEDSDVAIATSNPSKIYLHFLRRDDTGTVGEINVIKKLEKFADNINSISSEEWNMAMSHVVKLTSHIQATEQCAATSSPMEKGCEGTGLSATETASHDKMSYAQQVEEPICTSREIQGGVRSAVSLSIHVQGQESQQDAEEHSSAVHCAEAIEIEKHREIRLEAEIQCDAFDEIQCVGHDNNQNPPAIVSSTTVSEKAAPWFLAVKSKSAIELTTPTKEVVQVEVQVLTTDSDGMREPQKASVASINKRIAHSHDCEHVVEENLNANRKRKRLLKRRSRYVCHRSSSESEASRKVKKVVKRRRKALRSRAKSLQVVIKNTRKKAADAPIPMSQEDAGVALKRIVSTMKTEHIIGLSKVNEIEESEKEPGQTALNEEEPEQEALHVYDEEEPEQEALHVYDEEEPEQKALHVYDEEESEQEALYHEKEPEQETACQTRPLEEYARASTEGSYPSAEVETGAIFHSQDGLSSGNVAGKISCRVILYQQSQDTNGSELTDDDQGSVGFCGRRMAQRYAEEAMVHQREADLRRKNACNSMWERVSSGTTANQHFIHMNDDEEDSLEENEEFEKNVEEEEEEAESTARSSIDVRFNASNAGSYARASFVSVIETTSDKDCDSVISVPASNCFSHATARNCGRFYDAVDDNAPRAQLLQMDNLSNTGFLVNSSSDLEIPDTPSKNSLTATWRYAIHRPKWDETVDLCFICANQEFFVHRLVVVHYSRKLCRLLQRRELHPGQDIEVIGIDPMALHTVIQWMYTLEINIEKQNVLDVFLAAVCLDVKKLQVQCINKMHDIVREASEARRRRPQYAKAARGSMPFKNPVDVAYRNRIPSNVSQTHSVHVAQVTVASKHPLTSERFYEVQCGLDQRASSTSHRHDWTNAAALKDVGRGSRVSSASHSTASWTTKRSGHQIAFRGSNGRLVRSAPCGRQCVVERRRARRVGHREEWVVPRPPPSAEYPGEIYGSEEEKEYEVRSQTSYAYSESTFEPNSSIKGSVSVVASVCSVYSGSQRSSADHQSQVPTRERLEGSSLDDFSSFSFDERPEPPKKVMGQMDQDKHACSSTDLTEVVTIKKANTTKITNFKKANVVRRGARAYEINMLGVANVVTPVQMNKQSAEVVHGPDGHEIQMVKNYAQGYSHAMINLVNVGASIDVDKQSAAVQGSEDNVSRQGGRGIHANYKQRGKLLKNMMYRLAMPKNLSSDHVLLLGGLSRADKTDFDEAAQTVHCFDVQSGIYEKLGQLPTPLFDAAACCYGTGIYLTGGICQSSVTPNCPGKAIADVWYVDFHYPFWQKCRSMQHVRAGHCLVSMADRLYAIGGAEDSEGSRVTQTVEAYNPEVDAWTDVHPLPAPLWRMGAACLNGAIWLCGGMTDPIQVKTNAIFIYNPQIDRWTKHASHLLKKVAMASLVNAHGELVLVGGLSGSRDDDSMEGRALDALDVFDNDTQEWITMANMSDPRFIPSVVALGAQIVIIGGRDSRFSAPLKSVEIYVKHGAEWTHQVKSLPLPLSNSAVVGLPMLRRRLL